MARRRTPIFSAIDGRSISSGLQPDRHSLLKVLWESAANVVFWNGTVRRKIPPSTAFDMAIAAPVRGLGQLFDTSGSRWLWSAASSKIMRWRFGGPEVIDAAFGTYVADATATERPTLYDFTPYGNWMLVNSGQDGETAKIFKPGTPNTFNAFAPGEAPVGVVQWLKSLSFLIAVGYGPRGTQVGWSDANNVEVFTALSTNTAGSISIDEFNTPIRAGSRLADAISVFSEDQMALVRYIGAPYVFGQKTVLDGIGCVGKAAVASDTRVNVGMSRAGAWWTDGNSSKYIDEGFISNYFQENITWAQAAKIVVGRNDFTGCFEFHIPVRGSLSLNEAWSWDPRNGGWSPIAGQSAFDERRLFEHVIYGGNAGVIRLGDFNTAGVGALTLETKPIVMSTAESPHVVTRVDEVDLLLHAASNVEWRLGCADEPNGPWTWSDWLEAVAGAPVGEVTLNSDDGQPLPETPYWKLALRSVPGADDWTLDLQGFLFYGAQTGARM